MGEWSLCSAVKKREEKKESSAGVVSETGRVHGDRAT